MLTRNRKKITKILLLLREIYEGSLYEEPETTDIPDFESEESATE